MFRTLMINIFLILVEQATASTTDDLPSSCQNFSISMFEKSYLPSDVISINASCYEGCPSWDIISYSDDYKLLENHTVVHADGRCDRNMSILVDHFESLKKRFQLAVNFSNPGSEPVRTINFEKSDDGEKCHQDWDCYRTDQTCTGTYGSCACPPQHTFVNSLGKCYPVVSRYYGVCQFTEQCQAYKSICKDSACQCPDHYFPYSRIAFNCLPEGRSIGEFCATDDNCQQRDIYTWCSNGRCACNSNYIQSFEGCHSSARSFGESCTTNENCQQTDMHTWCIFGLCECKTNYIHVDGACHSSGRSLGESCITDDNCQQSDTNTRCTNGRCNCKSSYYQSYRSCYLSSAGTSRLDCAWTGILLTAFYILFTS